MNPKELFFTKGIGRHKDFLASFEAALRDAGIEAQNLVTVSSIFPPDCKEVSRADGLKKLKPGQITFCVMARNASNEPNRRISAAVGVALPTNKSHYGYLSEHHPFGEDEKTAGDYAEDLAATMLASTLGIEFDANQAWNEREQLYKQSGKIFKTRNITTSAKVDKSGTWTTVISVAVFILE